MTEENSSLRVFLSYSRKDAQQVMSIRRFLDQQGFETRIDAEDILPEEPWRRRLEALIDGADVVVFFLSPHSLTSTHCGWEVEHAAARGKRILPVVLSDAAQETVPARLQELNYLFLRNEIERRSNMERLAQTLRVNVGWLRFQTSLLDRALAWTRRERSEDELLTGGALEEAAGHLLSLPKDAPRPTDLVRDYVQQSLHAEELRKRNTLAAAEERAERDRRLRLDAESRQLAANSQLVANEQPDLSALLACEAWTTARTSAARRALMLQALGRPRLERYLAPVTRHRPSGAMFYVRDGIAFSRDGKWLAHVVEPSRTEIALWSTGDEIGPIGQMHVPGAGDEVVSMCISASGVVWATTRSRMLHSWRVGEPQPSSSINLAEFGVETGNAKISADPSGDRLAIANLSRLIVLRLSPDIEAEATIDLPTLRSVERVHWLEAVRAVLISGYLKAGRNEIGSVLVDAGRMAVARHYPGWAFPVGTGRHIVARGANEDDIQICETASGKVVGSQSRPSMPTFVDANPQLQELVYEKDGEVVFSSMDEAFSKVLLRHINVLPATPAHSQWVEAVVAAPLGSAVGYASLALDGSVALWSKQANRRLGRHLAGPETSSDIAAITFDDNGDRIFRIYAEGNFAAWNIADGTLIAEEAGIEAASFDATSCYVLRKSGQIARLSDSALVGAGEAGEYESCTMLGAKLVLLTPKGEIDLIDMATGKRDRLLAVEVPASGSEPESGRKVRKVKRPLAFCPQSGLLAIMQYDAAIELYDTSAPAKHPLVLRTGMDWVIDVGDVSIRFVGDGSRLLISGTEALELWDTKSGTLIGRYASGSTIGALWTASYSPAHGLIAAMPMAMGPILLLDSKTFAQVGIFPKPSHKHVWRLMFSRDGKMLATDDGAGGLNLISFDPDDWVDRLRWMAGRSLTLQERELYLEGGDSDWNTLANEAG